MILEYTWNDFYSFEFVNVCVMAQNIVSLAACCVGNWVGGEGGVYVTVVSADFYRASH